ncbi:thioredoxin family protein [Peptostreptococcaceae bacterium AGR-M142]|jgi:thioredoxin 1|nr:thioredoxin family protein [Peptostreptococcaceae bacterium]
MFVLDKKNFEDEVLKAEGYVFVDFWSESCEPCKALMPDVERLEEQYKGSMKFAKLDASKARRVAIKQKVLGLPTLAVFKDGEKIDELTKDDATVENIEAMIKKYA